MDDPDLLKQFDLSEFAKSDDNERAPTFLNSELGLFNLKDLFRSAKKQSESDEGIKQIVFVNDDEPRLFSEYLQPLAKNLAKQKRVVQYDLNSQSAIAESEFPLVVIDAGKTSSNDFKTFLRLEAPIGLCGYLANQENAVLINLCNIGCTHDDLTKLMTSFLDGYFGIMNYVIRPKNTHIVITGVYGGAGIKKSLSLGVWPRCRSAGVDWSKIKP